MNKNKKEPKTEKKTSRASRLKRLGIYEEVMWHEQYKEDREGDNDRHRADIETETTEEVFDRWCRGQNLRGFASLILRRVDQIRKLTNP